MQVFTVFFNTKFCPKEGLEYFNDCLSYVTVFYRGIAKPEFLKSVKLRGFTLRKSWDCKIRFLYGLQQDDRS